MPSFNDYRALIGQVDAVSIAVPTVDHLRVAREFLAAGVHVLVEKPMTSTLGEARAARACRSRRMCWPLGTRSASTPPWRLPFRSSRRRVSSRCTAQRVSDRSLDIDVVFDVMIHDLDIVLAIDHSDVVSVDAVGVPVLSHKVDIANARLKFASGCTVNLTATASAAIGAQVRFFQRDLYVSVDYGEQELEAYRIVQAGDRPAIEGGMVLS